MTLDRSSFALGFIAAYVFSVAFLAVLVGVTYALSRWKERKERDRTLDQLLSDVASRCREIPTDLSMN